MSQTHSITTSATAQEVYGDQFSLALAQTAATMDNPAYNGRLEKAIEFVRNGAVTLNTDGTATVVSGSHTYQVAGECPCADSQTRSKYCKHFLAVELLKRTLERLHHPATNGATKEPAPATPQAPHSAAWAVQEAPASCCLKWAINGLEIMYTMRDVDDEKLFTRVGRILPRIEEKLEAQRLERQARQEAKAQEAQATTPPASPPPPREKAEPEDDGAPWCDIHEVYLTRYTKDGRAWYSHQLPDRTWCRGR
jgi:hypothetical protein